MTAPALLLMFFLAVLFGPFALAYLIWIHRENNRLLRQARMTQRRARLGAQIATEYRLACEHTSDGLILQDMRGKIVWCNPAYCNMHRRPSEDIIGRNPLEFAPPPHLRPTPEELDQMPFDIIEGSTQRFQNQRATGEMFWIELRTSFHKGRYGQRHAIVVARDVTESVEQEQHLKDIRKSLEYEASHDALTGVANRAAFLTFIGKALNSDDANRVGLLHIDLDNFKDVNDTHGHPAGDAVLKTAARIIQQNLRDTDLVARVGGDEFVVVCSDSPDLEYLEDISGRLIKAVSEPLDWDEKTLQVEASIGAAQAIKRGTEPDKLLAQADFALYEAKRAGRNRVELYDAALYERHTIETQRAHDLADAIDTGAIDYVFQPSMDVQSGQIVGFETLVRWRQTEGGVIFAPDEFLSIASDIGQMAALDMLSMAAALEKKAALNKAGFDHVGIAFNASPELLDHPDFINRLTWGVEAANLDRDQIIIEVLENTDFGDAAQTSSHAAIIRDLRQAGFQVYLDDFGIGFAGLSHLASLDVSGVKIDRSLVKEILIDDVSRKIVRKIIELSIDLGLRVVAEGVEDADVSDALQAMGCTVIQGYWLARPLPSEDVTDWAAQFDQAQMKRRA